jgi:hypothetical protein
MRARGSRRRLVSVALVALAAAGWTTTARAVGDGCEAASGSTCYYRATRNGGIVATGNSWKVGVLRRGRYAEYGPASWVDAQHSTFRRTNVIRKGDFVYVRTGNMWGEWPPVVAGAVAVGSAYNR